MKIKKTPLRLMEKIWVKAIAVITVMALAIGLWDKWGAWAVVMVLAVLLVVFGYTLFRTRAVQLICEVEKVQREATRLLKGTKRSLYYYGGVGFIGNYQHWREELNKKLEDRSIRIVRFLDLKSLDEMKNMLKGTMEEGEINKEIEEYAQWLTTHSENLKYRMANNSFYHFEGAPIWKYGLHCIIFDKEHVVMSFLSSDGKGRNAIVIRDSPEVAVALADFLDWLTTTVGVKTISSDDLATLANI